MKELELSSETPWPFSLGGPDSGSVLFFLVMPYLFFEVVYAVLQTSFLLSFELLLASDGIFGHPLADVVGKA